MKKKFFLFLTALFILASKPLFCQTDAEESFIDSNEEEIEGVMSLRQISKLISERYLSEALRQLHIYIEKKPDYFDNAQVLVKRIMRLRQEYSVLAERAIKINNEHPEDDVTPMRIVEQMRAIEKDPPLEIRRMIAMLEEMHAYKYYANQYDEIQEQVQVYIAQNDYSSAVLENKKSFDFYKDKFEEDWVDYPEITETSVKILEDLNQQIDAIALYQASLSQEVQTFISYVQEDDFISAKNQYPSVQAVFSEYNDYYQKIVQCRQNYQELYKKQQEIKPEIGYTDASYLPFMLKAIAGVQDKPASGVLGVLTSQFSNSVESMKNSVTAQINKYSQNYLAALPEDIFQLDVDYSSYSDKSVYINPINNYADLGIQVNLLYAMLDEKKSRSDYDSAVTYIAKLSDKTVEIMSLAEGLRKEIDNQGYILAQMEIYKSRADFDMTVYADGLFESATKMNNLAASKADYMPDSYEWGRDYQNSSRVIDYSDFTNRYTSHLDQIFTKSEVAVVDVWKKLSESYNWSTGDYEVIAKNYADNQNKYLDGLKVAIAAEDFEKLSNNPEKMLEYIQNPDKQKTGQNQTDTIYYYPDLSAQMAEKLSEITESYIADIQKKQTSISNYMNSNAVSMENPEVIKLTQSTYSSLEKTKQELMSYNAMAKRTRENAQDKIDAAAFARNNADSLFEEAEEAYKKGRLDQAEQLLQEASVKYAEALSYSENYRLRNESDKRNMELSTQIVYAKNEIVVRESRAFYDQALDAQTHDRYDDAETYITAAINKWAETHDEKNPEFEDFRELINTAISMKTGRDLYPSDPLYAEMSQLLSVAYQYYDLGSGELSKGNKEAAEEALANASDSLARLKKVYPLNQEASLLLLKIERLQDPKKFNAEFKQRITIAKEKCNVASTQTEGYNDLIAYSNFEPDWPGLKNDIYNIEIKLGMRQKPVDNSAIARAQRLYNDARRIYNSAGSDEKKLRSALNSIDEALALNPTYTAARNLKDTINIKLGGDAPLVLPAADQDLLERARSAFQANKIDEANSYMTLLLSHNPNYEKIKSVSDLKKRIEANL